MTSLFLGSLSIANLAMAIWFTVGRDYIMAALSTVAAIVISILIIRLRRS
jgi:hypothetical protein